MQDLRDAFRALRSTRWATAATILSLALIIGANTTIFSLLSAIVFRPLPVPQPEQLVLVSSGPPDRPTTSWQQSIWQEVRDREVIERGFAWYWSRFDTAVGGERDFVDGLVVSGQAFASLELQPALGRLLSPTDESSLARVAVISHGYWTTKFSGSTDVLGRSVTLDRRPFTIVGVTPRAFSGLDVGLPFDIAVPMQSGRAPGVDLVSAPYVTVGGLVLGVVGARWAGRLVELLLFGVEPGDGTSLAGACLVLSLVAAVAVWLPARRATRIDIARLLRET